MAFCDTASKSDKRVFAANVRSSLLMMAVFIGALFSGAECYARPFVGWNPQKIPLAGPYWAKQRLRLRLTLQVGSATVAPQHRLDGVYCVVNGVERPAHRSADNKSYELVIEIPSDVDKVTAFWRLRSRSGTVQSAKTSARVIPPVQLPKQSSITWSAMIPGGCAETAACKDIKALSQIALPRQASVWIQRPGQVGNPFGKVVIRTPKGPPKEVVWAGAPVVVPMSPNLAVCLVPPRCKDRFEAMWSEDITVDVVTRGGKSVSKGPMTVGLQARYEPGSWLECYAVWFAVLAAFCFIAFVWVGITKPASFSKSAQIKIADSERKLRRASYLLLRRMRGGRSGFYRSAEVRISSSGFAIKGRGAVFQLRPGQAGAIHIFPRAKVERKERGRWQPVASGESLSSGACYRCGQIFFQIV